MDRDGSFADRFKEPHVFTTSSGVRLELNQTPPSIVVSADAPPGAAVDELGTGTTVWRAAVSLARLLTSSFSHLVEGKRVLELGSGTGLAGLAAGAAGASSLLLTDLPPVLPLLRSNVSRNSFIQTTTPVVVSSFEWGLNVAPSGVDVILAADCCYHASHPVPLSRTVVASMVRGDEPAERAILSCEKHDPIAHAALKRLLAEQPALAVTTLWESGDGRIEVIGVSRR